MAIKKTDMRLVWSNNHELSILVMDIKKTCMLGDLFGFELSTSNFQETYMFGALCA